MSFSLGLSNVSQGLAQAFLAKCDRHDGGFFPLCPFLWHTISICSMTEVHFDHLIKTVSAGFLHCKVALLSFVINNYVGRYCEIM